MAVSQPATTSGSNQSHLPLKTRPTVSGNAPTASDSIDNTDQGISGHTPSPNSYEFALHGLLALGSTSGTIEGVAFPPGPLVDEGQAVSSYDFASSSVVEPSQNDGNVQRRPEMRRTETGHQSSLSFNTVDYGTPGLSPSFQTSMKEDKSRHVHRVSDTSADISHETGSVTLPRVNHNLELLKFFRYQVASWLDICDSDQHFGVTLLTESTQNPSLRACVLRLSASSSSMACASVGSYSGRSSSYGNTSDGNVPDAAVKTVVGVIDVLAYAVPSLAAFWREGVANQTNLFEESLIELSSSDLSTCAYWLLVRLGKCSHLTFEKTQLTPDLLELSRALMAGDNRIPLPPLTEQGGQLGSNNPMAQCAYDAIALCVDACMFAQGDDDRWLQQRYGLNRVEVWRTLVQKFAHWYMRRSHEFQPIIDLYPKDGVLTDDDYPTIVFTSGSALLANQLYHTGMLLLLQHKPRFADKPSQNSPSMSTLWHAHRVCGIAIQDDRSGWWDPCLVASLIVAGRTATHASQHDAIVSTLEFVQRLTGWSIDACIEQLKGEWRLADSW